MGWLLYLVRVTAAATNANLLVIALGEFWPGLGVAWGSAVLAGILGALGILNIRGVSGGAAASNLLSIGKVVPLALFAIGGVALVARGGGSAPAPVEAGAGVWLHAILLLVFAYGGFESALFPLAEARHPERDAPFALLVALASVTVLYTLTQFVVTHALPDPAESVRPVVAAARALGGNTAATIMAWAAVISVTGYLAGATLNVPRLTYAMAERGDLPGILERLHPRYQTPWVSVLAYVTLVWLLATSGSFLQNLTLSAVSRLVTYGAVCLAMLRMRRLQGIPPARFVVPAGPVVAVLGVSFGLLLLSRTSLREAVVLAGTVVAALLTWLWRRRG
jgi:amino acid transporter